MAYSPPLDDFRFILKHHLGFEAFAALQGCEPLTEELAVSVLEEAGKLAVDVFQPLNQPGDREGLRFEGGKVFTPSGFRDAYQAYVAGGWNGLAFSDAHGGQNLPFTCAVAVQEMLQAANISLALCTLLNQGAIELLHAHGTPAQQENYLPKLVSGEWTGTMNLTEPQAGSDVGAVRCKAWKEEDHYRVQGQKIFISYGEHDLSDNIIHLVLARLPDAAPGTKGLSLFLVPKLLADGTANDVRCISIEHKLGQHASPACTMAFGDNGGAWGELVGREGGGIESMFVMMNNARLGVGVQGLGLCELATQAAAEFARGRIQSRPLGNPKAEPVAIINHPDVRRMLMLMRSQTEAARALALRAAFAADQAKHNKDGGAQARVDLLTPVVKAWLTDLANEITSTAVQVFGGMGFVEETGVAQHMRDARVLAIYEGTNGIQANDLLFRKVVRDEGKALGSYMAEILETLSKLREEKGDDAESVASALLASLEHLQKAAAHLISAAKTDVNVAALAAVPFLRLAALVAGGHEMAVQTLAVQNLLRAPDGFAPDYLEAKLIRARFYAESVLAQTGGLLATILNAQKGVLALGNEQF